jgi:ABC-type metal ion transport system substrate-binding protein
LVNHQAGPRWQKLPFESNCAEKVDLNVFQHIPQFAINFKSAQKQLKYVEKIFKDASSGKYSDLV